MASDEVTDLIALIEMHRQEEQKETGLAAACNAALRKLHELLESERAALQVHGPENGYPGANIEAVTNQIQRVKNLLAGGGTKQRPFGQRRPQQQPLAGPGGPRNQARNKGRRAMGRRGDR